MRMRSIGILFLSALLAAPSPVWSARVKTMKFKDASSPAKKAIKEFNKRGILGDFLAKYGNTYFRPTTTLTREDLLLALFEYDQVVRTMRNYRAQVSKSLVSIKSRVDVLEKAKKAAPLKKTDVPSSKQIDAVVKEIQNRLPMLLNNTPVPKKINDRFKAIDRKLEHLDEMPASASGTSSLSNARIKKMIRKEVKRAVQKETSLSLAKVQKQTKNQKSSPAGQNKLVSKLAISLGMLAAIFLAR